MSKLQGKVALVTGGNSGIGLATAKEFHAQGAKVVISGRNRETLAVVEKELGEGVLTVPSNVSKLSDIDELMAQTKATFGNLDILFVNAGIVIQGMLGKVTEEDFDAVINTNFKGAFFTIQKALPLLNDGASIIINGSINAHMAIPGSSIYSASKAAIHSLSRSLSSELIERGIRVNTITIGPTETPILGSFSPEQYAAFKQHIGQRSPVKRLGTSEEIAKVALFLASSDSSFVVGSEIYAEGGMLFNRL
ncbi:SDR family oxidoreductase [Ktedonospora formicarum]|uniref:Oxidoreductase n=1 Tax=Ktedonospora formicarum TaxID=2778364 RepID=A0A8J3IBM0_9CHLR|nr:SDR family oxidoreductase [Ktedonospora formicarum]GHO48384.1 oxidoreductase [Ktedonospora formicarum]